MKKHLKRITAFLLTVTLVVSMFAMMPVQADALSYSGSSSYSSGKYYRALKNVQLTGNQRTDIVNVARSQVGYQEGSNSSQLSGEVRGSANYTEYGRWYGLQDMWCAMFVSWCANVAGISTSVVPKHSYTPSGLSWFKQNGRAYSRATVANGGYTPQAGDIIYFKSSRNSNTTNHIGIVTGYSGSTVYTIEGNTSSATISTNGGAVAEKSYSIYNTYIVYICKPNYSGTNISGSTNTGSSTTTNANAKALTFDAAYYANRYSDLKAAYGTDEAKLYEHFLNFGIKEGRQAHPCFDVKYYLNSYPDLLNAFGNDYTKAYQHYLNYGYKEYQRYSTAEPADLGVEFLAKISFSSKNLSLDGDNVILYTPSSAPAQVWRFIRQGNGSYKIVNTKNNKCLDAQSATDNSGANIWLCDDNGTNAQRWFIYSYNGKYVLRPECARVTVMDVAGASTNDLTNIQQHTYNGSSAQLFTINKVDAAAPTVSDVTITEVNENGYRVTCTVSSALGIKEVKFPTWTVSNDQDDLVWHMGSLEGNTATYYVSVKDHNSESGDYNTHIYAYDLAGKSTVVKLTVTVPKAKTLTAEDTKALTFDAAYYANRYPDLKAAFGTDEAKLYEHYLNYGIKEGRQAHPCFDVKYYLNSNSDLKDAYGSDYTKAYQHYLKYGYQEYHRVNTAEPANLGDEFCAKISFASMNLSLNEDNVILYTPSSAPAQVWKFIRQSNGSYKIVNTKNGMCLDAAAATDNSGANVGICGDNGTNAQRWFLYSYDGKYVLRPECARMTVLDVAGAATSAYTNIQQYQYNGSSAQLFTLQIVSSN